MATNFLRLPPALHSLLLPNRKLKKCLPGLELVILIPQKKCLSKILHFSKVEYHTSFRRGLVSPPSHITRSQITLLLRIAEILKKGAEKCCSGVEFMSSCVTNRQLVLKVEKDTNTLHGDLEYHFLPPCDVS